MAVITDALSEEEVAAIQQGLEDFVRATKIVGGGAKMTEGHWHYIYSRARGADVRGFSPENFRDYSHKCIGVESKVLQDTAKKLPITRLQGKRRFAVSTRKITFNPLSGANECKDAVLGQFGEHIDKFHEWVVSDESCDQKNADLRWGILLWKTSLTEFLYFEDGMVKPEPSDFEGQFKSGSVTQKDEDDNLWIYEKGQACKDEFKRFTVTMPKHGAKLSPSWIIPKIGSGSYHFAVKPDEREPLWFRPDTVKIFHEIAEGRDHDEVMLELLAKMEAMRNE